MLKSIGKSSHHKIFSKSRIKKFTHIRQVLTYVIKISPYIKELISNSKKL